jgi:hypothetical protein
VSFYMPLYTFFSQFAKCISTDANKIGLQKNNCSTLVSTMFGYYCCCDSYYYYGYHGYSISAVVVVLLSPHQVMSVPYCYYQLQKIKQYKLYVHIRLLS